jgi:hypothetical protein
MRGVGMGRGRAIRVTGSPDCGAVIAKRRELIDFAGWHGYHREELIAPHVPTSLTARNTGSLSPEPGERRYSVEGAPRVDPLR